MMTVIRGSLRKRNSKQARASRAFSKGQEVSVEPSIGAQPRGDTSSIEVCKQESNCAHEEDDSMAGPESKSEDDLVCSSLAVVGPDSALVSEMCLGAEVNEEILRWVRGRVKNLGRSWVRSDPIAEDVERSRASMSKESSDDFEADPIVCTPLAVVLPGDNSNLECFSNEESQDESSVWAKRRAKIFGKFLGVSCLGFEDKIMDLLLDIEKNWRSSEDESRRKGKKSKEKCKRELKQLCSSWNSEHSGRISGEGRRSRTLS